jgi:hypothetical protein
MNCTVLNCHGLIIWVPPEPVFKGHYRCQRCRKVYKKAEVELMRKQQERSPLNEALDVLLPDANAPIGKVPMPEPAPLFVGKVCGKCGGPAKTLDAFGKNAAEKDGKQKYCKVCMKQAVKTNRKNRRNHLAAIAIQKAPFGPVKQEMDAPTLPWDEVVEALRAKMEDHLAKAVNLYKTIETIKGDYLPGKSSKLEDFITAALSN